MGQVDARPLLFVISGPSGAGKGTALRRMVEKTPVVRVPTYTTRMPRLEETDGWDYRFVGEDEFSRLVADGSVFEYERTYSTSYYGSPSLLLDGTDQSPLAVELDPNGFGRVRALSARRVVGIFVTTSSEAALQERIALRGPVDDLTERVRVRAKQLAWSWAYDYILFNDERGYFHKSLETVVASELIRTDGARKALAIRTDPSVVKGGLK